MIFKKSLVCFIICLLSIKAYEQTPEKNQQEGFFNIMQAELTLNSNNEKRYLTNKHVFVLDSETFSSTGIALNYVKGYFLIPRFLSIGIGAKLNYNTVPSLVSVPVFVDLRLFGVAYNESFYFNLNFGRSFNMSQSYRNSRYIKIAIGWQQYFDKNKCFVFDFGFAINPISRTNQAFQYSNHRLTLLGFLFSAGFMF